jgi:hypothetical protein
MQEGWKSSIVGRASQPGRQTTVQDTRLVWKQDLNFSRFRRHSRRRDGRPRVQGRHMTAPVPPESPRFVLVNDQVEQDLRLANAYGPCVIDAKRRRDALKRKGMRRGFRPPQFVKVRFADWALINPFISYRLFDTPFKCVTSPDRAAPCAESRRGGNTPLPPAYRCGKAW